MTTSKSCMPEERGKIDENIIAAYLSGDLPANLKKEIAAYLAQDESALEVLEMAGEALSSVRPDSEKEGGKRKSKRQQRENVSSKYIRSSRASLFTITAVLLVLVGIFALDYLNDYTKMPPENMPSVEIDWTPVIGTNRFGISWPGVENAASYVIIVMDPSQEKLLSRIETANTSIPRPFDSSVTKVPPRGKVLELWISAFSESGELLRRSDRIPFTAGA